MQEMENRGSKISQTALVFEEEPGISFSSSSSTSRRLLFIITLICLILFIAGIVLIATAVKKCPASSSSSGKSSGTSAATDRCKYSEEAEKVGLDKFLKKVRDTYYKLHPEQSVWRPMSTTDTIRKEYSAYDPTPSAIKKRTDIAYQLLKEINEIKIEVDILKPREYKALLQVKHYLKYIFGTPYDGNYYAGDWMLGPTSFCWQPICSLGYDINNNIGNLKPRTASEVGDVIKHFQAINATVLQYIANMKLGIQTGMVRTMKECEAGMFSMKKTYENVSEQGERGALNEWYTKPFKNMTIFLEKLPANEQDKWKNRTGKSANESLTNAIIEHIGGPLAKLLKYLEKEHSLHCRPNNVGGGGISGLPIDFIYYNGTANKSMKTSKRLPIADTEGRYPTLLNGSKSYELILGYFTTKDFHPNEVHQLGWTMVNKLFPQAESIAREITNITNTTEAVATFQLRLTNLSLSYFNTKAIPEDQTKGNATKLCKNKETAKKYCPDRWAAIEKYFEFARKAMAMLDPKTVSMFYFTGDKHTTPNCPITVKADYNPGSGAASYQNSDQNCTYNAVYSIPFFLKDVGPRFAEYSTSAHEGRPGHHTQVQGNVEHFRDKCAGLPKWLDEQTYYTAFTEGWALYAENPLIAQQTDTYKDNLMQKYGMLQWQIWRALRLVVDTGMHYKGMTRQEAMNLFAKYAWDTTDLADKEVTRYQSNPGQATGYMIGQLDIWKFRNKTQKALGDKFSLKDFHYQALSQGSSPLSYLQSHIDKYIACMKDAKKKGCDLILNPTKAGGSFSVNQVNHPELERISPRKRHFR